MPLPKGCIPSEPLLELSCGWPVTNVLDAETLEVGTGPLAKVGTWKIKF